MKVITISYQQIRWIYANFQGTILKKYDIITLLYISQWWIGASLEHICYDIVSDCLIDFVTYVSFVTHSNMHILETRGNEVRIIINTSNIS